MTCNPEALAALLESVHYSYANEEQLCDGLEQVLAPHHTVLREHPVAGGRLDLYLPECGVALEVKTAGAPGTVLRQLQRYAASPDVHGLVLVTTRFRHRFGESVGGKPLATVKITRLV